MEAFWEEVACERRAHAHRGESRPCEVGKRRLQTELTAYESTRGLSTAPQHRNDHPQVTDPKTELRKVKSLSEVTQQGSSRAGV